MPTKTLNPDAPEFRLTNNQVYGHKQHAHPPPPPSQPLICLPRQAPPLALPHNLLPQECYYTPVSNYHCPLPYYDTMSQPQAPSIIPHFPSDQFPNSYYNNPTFHGVYPNWPGKPKQIMGNEGKFLSERMMNVNNTKNVVNGGKMHEETFFSPRWGAKQAYPQGQFAGGAVTSPPISPTTPPPRGGGPVGGGARSPPQHRTTHWSSGKTTVMIRNIPNQLRRDDILEFLDRFCRDFKLEYDFVYLPMDFKRKGNLGYAFVNFTKACFARTIMKVLHRHEWGLTTTVKGKSFVSSKICEMNWARVQGKDDLVRKFRSSNFACQEMDFLPVVFNSPRNGSDLKPSPVVLGQLMGAVRH